MRQNAASGWGLLLIMGLLFLLSGCASKIPTSLPLGESKKPFIVDRFQEFQNRPCSQSFDGDVTIQWRMYGKTEKIPGMLQLQSPAFLRYAVVDPLGRQLLILVTDGNSFTLVDNRNAKALTGQIDSHFWQKYIPGFISAEDYLPWLTGRLPAGTFKVIEIRAVKNSVDAVWLITEWKDAIRHHVLFSPSKGRIKRHIVEGENDEIVFDVTYSDYGTDARKCPKPHLLQIEGSEISGSIRVQFDKILPEAPIPPRLFHVTLPDHFTVKSVD